MADPLAEPPTLLDPYIVSTDLDQTVPILKGPFQLIGEADGTLTADLVFRWTPTTAVAFNGTFSQPFPGLSNSEWSLRSLSPPDFEVPVHITGSELLSQAPPIRGTLAKPLVLGGGPFGAVRFCLANFPDYLGKAVRFDRHDSQGTAAVRLAYAGAGGRCIVDAVLDARDLQERARRDAGFFVSHVGQWTPDSGTLSAEEAHDVLEMLRLWFGLLRGAWAGPLFPQGLLDGQVVWKSYASWKLSESREVPSWLPDRSPVDLAELFAGFSTLWSDPNWRQPLRYAISWLVEANASRTANESRIVLSQVALELLAWVRVVETKQLHSRADFKKLSAAGKLRILLHDLGIPASIPDHLTHLPSLRKGDAIDGPGVITRVRNALVHATDDNRATVATLDGVQLLECAQLTLVYVELVLLALCGYRGKFARRAFRGWKGDDEVLVPWAAS